MTAKDREIQVYEMNEDQIPSDWPRDFVAHSDHLRAVKLAQIDVLEELVDHMTKQFICAANPKGEYCDEESIWIGHKLIRLRKELENG